MTRSCRLSRREGAASGAKPVWQANVQETGGSPQRPSPSAHERSSDIKLRIPFEKFLAEQHEKRGNDRARSEIRRIVEFLFDLIGDTPPRRCHGVSDP